MVAICALPSLDLRLDWEGTIAPGSGPSFVLLSEWVSKTSLVAETLGCIAEVTEILPSAVRGEGGPLLA